MVPKKMILRNDFGYLLPKKIIYKGRGDGKTHEKSRCGHSNSNIAVLKCLEVIDLVEKAMSAWAINLKIL